MAAQTPQHTTPEFLGDTVPYAPDQDPVPFPHRPLNAGNYLLGGASPAWTLPLANADSAGGVLLGDGVIMTTLMQFINRQTTTALASSCQSAMLGFGRAGSTGGVIKYIPGARCQNVWKHVAHTCGKREGEIHAQVRVRFAHCERLAPPDRSLRDQNPRLQHIDGPICNICNDYDRNFFISDYCAQFGYIKHGSNRNWGDGGANPISFRETVDEFSKAPYYGFLEMNCQQFCRTCTEMLHERFPQGKVDCVCEPHSHRRQHLCTQCRHNFIDRRKAVHRSLFRALVYAKITTRGSSGGAGKWKGIRWNLRPVPGQHPDVMQHPCRLCGKRFPILRHNTPATAGINYWISLTRHALTDTKAGWCSYCEGIVVAPPRVPPYPGHTYVPRHVRRSPRRHVERRPLVLIPLDPIPRALTDWHRAGR